MRTRTPGNAPQRVVAAPVLLLTSATGLALQCLRVLFPLLYGVYERGGVAPAAGLAAAVFAAPALWLVLPRKRTWTWAAIGSAVAGRLAIQVVAPAPLWLATLAAVASLIVVTRAFDLAGPAVALGLALGVALDTATLASFMTWDPAFSGGALAFVAVLAWSGATGLGARRVGEMADMGSARTWALGPALALAVLFLANPAFVASQTSLGPAAAAGVTLAGCAVAVSGTLLRRIARTAILAAALIVTIATAGLPAVTGLAFIPLLVAVQGSWGVALGTLAIGAARRSGGRGPVPTAIGTLVFAGVLFAYQLDVEQPLPFPRWILPATAGLLLAVAAVRATGPGAVTSAAQAIGPNLRWIALPVTTMLIVPLIIGADAPTTPRRITTTIRILDWNVHGSVDATGAVDPAGIAAAIAAQDPDVVVLQEVARGWPIHGGIDLAAWLSRSLAMPYRWASAADSGSGNVVLSRLPIIGSQALQLPYGGGPQHRSALRVTLDAGAGRTLTVIGTHLQNRAGSDVGTLQASDLIRTWGADSGTVVAGDLNAQPGDPATVPLFGAGLVSAQDAEGNPQASTARDPRFQGDRVDWMFTSPDLRVTSFGVIATDASDHLPLLMIVELA